MEKLQNALVRGRQLCTQPSNFAGSLAECFVFDVVNFENMRKSGRIVSFWRCQVQELRKSRGIAAFLLLSSSKTEEVSQNSFVSKLADRQIDFRPPPATTTTTSTTTSTITATVHYTKLITLQHTATKNTKTTTLHYTTLHYANCVTFQYNYIYSCNRNYNYHYTALHYTN